MRRSINLFVLAIAAHGVIAFPAHADFIEVVGDQAAWQNALREQESIFFTEFPPGTGLWDQYEDLGILFTDGNDVITSSAANPDGGGVLGLNGIGVAFDQPRTAIAIDFPGGALIQLYSEGDLIFTSNGYGAPGGDTLFFGILSNQPFDAARIHDPAFSDFHEIDNLYFGDVIPAPGAMALFGVAGISMRRRRRRERRLECEPHTC